MREALKDRVGKRGLFSARFQRRGTMSNDWGVTVTLLFVDVRDEAQTLVTDHLWFKMGKRMDELKPQPGDRISFMATVDTYEKRNRDSDGFGDDGPRHVVDYRLTHPSNVRRIGDRPPERKADGNQMELGL